MKRPLVFLIGILLILGLSACERSIAPSRTTPSAPTQAGGQAPATGDVMGQLELFVTQTAMAAQGAGGQASPQVTPPAGGETAAPAPDQTTPAAPAEGETTVPPAAESPAPEAQATTPPVGPAPTTVVVPTATPGIPSTYTLQQGEHPFCIARRFNVDPGELLRANGLGVNSTVYPGTSLTIPQSANPFPDGRALQAHPTTHTVQAGESINSIACQYGDVDPNAIAFANSLEAPYQLTAGQTLQIP